MILSHPALGPFYFINFSRLLPLMVLVLYSLGRGRQRASARRKGGLVTWRRLRKCESYGGRRRRCQRWTRSRCLGLRDGCLIRRMACHPHGGISWSNDRRCRRHRGRRTYSADTDNMDLGRSRGISGNYAFRRTRPPRCVKGGSWWMSFVFSNVCLLNRERTKGKHV